MAKRATKTRAPKRAPRRGRRNPDETSQAAELYEKFHGREATRSRTVIETTEERTTLASLGRLIELQVYLPSGKLVGLDFHGTTVTLASSPDGGQLYFLKGDQQLDLSSLGLARYLPKDHVAVGSVWKIVYHTSKAFHNFEPTDYVHEFGEENGILPVLGYDTQSRKLYLTGGSYQVKPEGIVN